MENQKPKYWLTQKEKSERAFQAYLDLLDAADYMKARVYDQLADHGLTIRGVRVLELLYRQGDQVALRLNQRPRKTLGFQTPASKLQASVASTD